MESAQKKRIKKRRRTVITPDEIERLEDSFRTEPKPDRNLKLGLARELSKTENFINIWFQNRRAKERKLVKNPPEEEDSVPSPSNTHNQSASSSHMTIDAPPLFRRMITMAAASEGGILSPDCPDINRAITDCYRGIRLRDGVLRYSNENVFELSEIPE